jgi:hypothetical protein
MISFGSPQGACIVSRAEEDISKISAQKKCGTLCSGHRVFCVDTSAAHMGTTSLLLSSFHVTTTYHRAIIKVMIAKVQPKPIASGI